MENSVEITVGDAKTRSSMKRVRDQAFLMVENLLGKKPETILSIEKTDKGWRTQIEVLERKAVPDTQDILARYELLFNDDCEILGWKQVMIRKRSDRLLPEEDL